MREMTGHYVECDVFGGSGIKKDLEMIENGEMSDEDILKMWNKVKE